MSVRDSIAIAFLVAGVGVELVCCLALLRIRDPFDRLHILGPASTIGPIAVAAFFLIRYGFHPAGIKAAVLALALFVFGPVLTHATARAARMRAFEGWRILDQERTE